MSFEGKRQMNLDELAVLAECYVPSNTQVSEYTRRYFGDYPTYKPSDDDPPIIRDQNGQWHADLQPDFESLLGKYDSKIRRITVFKKGVLWLANEYDWHPEHLRRVVDLHEWAHALHHLGSFEIIQTAVLDHAKLSLRKRFRKAPEDFKEQVAQLTTLLALRSAGAKVTSEKARKFYAHLEDMLFLLMPRQSVRYRLPDFTRSINQSRLQKKLQLLFRMSDQGRYPSLSEITDILE